MLPATHSERRPCRRKHATRFLGLGRTVSVGALAAAIRLIPSYCSAHAHGYRIYALYLWSLRLPTIHSICSFSGFGKAASPAGLFQSFSPILPAMKSLHMRWITERPIG